jgi:hypothetical protein
MKQIKESVTKNRFGEVREIVKDDWVREVTDDSKTCSVVIHLYQDSLIECQIVDEAILQLAKRFRYVKFLRIKADQAIENWPERNLPTIFIYEDGNLKSQLITIKSVGGKRMQPEGIFFMLY